MQGIGAAWFCPLIPVTKACQDWRPPVNYPVRRPSTIHGSQAWCRSCRRGIAGRVDGLPATLPADRAFCRPMRGSATCPGDRCLAASWAPSRLRPASSSTGSVQAPARGSPSRRTSSSRSWSTATNGSAGMSTRSVSRPQLRHAAGGWPRAQVSARRGDTGMAQGGLHEMDRSASVEQWLTSDTCLRPNVSADAKPQLPEPSSA